MDIIGIAHCKNLKVILTFNWLKEFQCNYIFLNAGFVVSARQYLRVLVSGLV